VLGGVRVTGVVEWNGRPGIRSHGFDVGTPPFNFRLTLGGFLAFSDAAARNDC
jgi:hypothetical protein